MVHVFKNGKQAQEVLKLKKKGYTYPKIAEMMSEKYGIKFGKNRAIRYKKYAERPRKNYG